MDSCNRSFVFRHFSPVYESQYPNVVPNRHPLGIKRFVQGISISC